MEKETQEYLLGIKNTIEQSRRLIESVKLRFAETDRLLADSGTTREEVKGFKFTPGQLSAVNDELRRRGFPPVEDPPPESDLEIAAVASPLIGAADVQGDMENRRRKFSAMMKQFRM